MELKTAIKKAKLLAKQHPYSDGYGVWYDDDYNTYRVADNNDILDMAECLSISKKEFTATEYTVNILKRRYWQPAGFEALRRLDY